MHLLDLPEEVLKIIVSFCPKDLMTVSKLFRILALEQQERCTIKADLLSPSCGLVYMKNLRHLCVIGSEKVADTQKITELLQSVKFKNLNHLTLVSFNFYREFKQLIKSIQRSNMLLQLLECKSCTHVKVNELLFALWSLPKLSCCIVEVNITSASDKEEFADIVNNLVGKVNFHLNSLCRLPNSLLWHNWAAYRSMYPTGLF